MRGIVGNFNLARFLSVAVPFFLVACGGSSDGSSDAVNIVDTAQTQDVEEQLGPGGESIAREWNEVLLTAIRNDFARPTIHARNLFHISAAMYDAWAVYSAEAETYLLGNTVDGFECSLDGFNFTGDVHSARQEAISYAAYRLIDYRFRLSPGVLDTEDVARARLEELGFDRGFKSVDYSDGSPAALGNYIASCYIAYGLQDGSNEQGFFANQVYQPVNQGLAPQLPGNLPQRPRDSELADMNRWQPLNLATFIDQSGNQILGGVEFLSPEWGQVHGFALTDDVKTTYTRDGFDYQIYYDPGMPPGYGLDVTEPATANQDPGQVDIYKWGFSLVSIWSSHLDPFFTHPDPARRSGSSVIDISPASIGDPRNSDIDYYPPNFKVPASLDQYKAFYDTLDGGDPGQGYALNPKTGQPYEPQLVRLGDYGRVLAEFWADGPDSETPPGHWFTILNEVTDHPELVRKFEGAGEELGPLEWDVKAYFALGGTMHDAAIAAWGIKGWYDYIRPISAIRAMADKGQSSDPTGVNYSVDGIPLEPGFIELVEAGDPLAGASAEHVGKIKVLAWRGPDFITDPATSEAGVGWILAENWYPYQRPSFVTPPFAGYVSGHSTYSRAAAELLTLFTGDPFFPGGMSGFEVTANEFLVFEEGPSQDMILEWATYRDASDQCSLSRIWGGIHPPADDIPGRLIGEKIGPAAFVKAKAYFAGE